MCSGRQVISRSGRPTLQSESSSCFIKANVFDSEEQPTILSSADLTEYGETDIFNDEGWDTDLDEKDDAGETTNISLWSF